MKKYTYVWCRGIAALENSVNANTEYKPCRFTQCAEQEAKELLQQMGTLIDASTYMEAHNNERQNPAPHAHMAPLKIAFAGCPNGCSQFQIADIAFVAAHKPELHQEACIGCGVCIETCPETREHALTQGVLPVALKMQDKKVQSFEKIQAKVQFIAQACSACGLCINSCPTQALQTQQEKQGQEQGLGWRLFVGGKLGRHPHLAQEYVAASGQHIWSREAILALALQFVEQFSTEWKPRLRLAHVVWK